MSERKLLYLALFGIIYCVYSVQLWIQNRSEDKKPEHAVVQQVRSVLPTVIIKKQRKASRPSNTCDVKEILIVNPFVCEMKKHSLRSDKMHADTNNNTVTVIGIMFFLVILTMNAILDVVKAKEEEQARRKLNPDGERRQSLAEFAKTTSLRRESIKFGQHLYQIAESMVTGNGNKDGNHEVTKKRQRLYVRGESTNSYLSDKKKTEGSAPASIGDPGTEPKLVKRQSVAKLFGARPVPMVRRSSFPALPLNPDVQAIMLGHKQSSFDSDDEDGKGKRVRIIRRY